MQTLSKNWNKEETLYSRQNPFLTKLLSRSRLNRHGSTKETWHVVVSLEGSDLKYRPGDSFGILPTNDPDQVNSILQAFGFSGAEMVVDTRCHEEMTIKGFLSKRANLATCTRKLLSRLHPHHPLVQPGQEETLREYFQLYNVPEIIQEHLGVSLEPQDIASTIAPLLPRLYSIASSQHASPDEVHFTVSRVRYDVQGRKRLGVCSHFLCDLVEVGANEVPIYLQETKDFLLPENNEVPIIMIGPGTGIAPFRAFLQERMATRDSTSKNWLFFGERHKNHDFFYEEYLQELVEQGNLRLELAFSRDQEEKVYVQHKMWQSRREIWQWIQDGAKVYVCGDASRMAKDVDKTLQDIAREEGNLTEESARAFITELRRHKRYLRDVY